MSEKKFFNKEFDEFSLKKAIFYDIGQILFQNQVIVDPVPMPFLPITPIVIGKKVINCTKNIICAIKSDDY